MLYDVLYQRCPAWIVGERDGDARRCRRIAAPPGLDGAALHYPDDYAGRVISVVPQGHFWGPGDLADPMRAVMTLDLDDLDLADLRSRGRKIGDPSAITARSAMEAVSFDDRWGAVAEVLRGNFDDVEKAEAAQDDELSEPGRRFAELSAVARSFLAPTVVHSGAGLYEVGPGKTYSTIQSALDQLWTDQGSTPFGAIQYIRVFAGTYDENVTPNADLNPQETVGWTLVIEGDPADDRDNIILQPTSGTYGIFVNCDHAIIRHMKVDGTAGITSQAVRSYTGATNFEVRDCAIAGHSGHYAVETKTEGLIADCTITTDGYHALYGVEFLRVENCIIKNVGAKGVSIGILTMLSASIVVCTIRGFNIGIHVSGRMRAWTSIANCTAYDCDYGITVLRPTIQVEIINTIVTTVTSILHFGYDTLPDEGDGYMSGPFTLRNNCFYSYTNFLSTASWTKTYAEFAAYDRVDAAGDLDATDPLLTAPASDDFSLQAASPCRNAGHGSGVFTDYLGTAFDAAHPDIGAWSSGVLSGAPTIPSVTATATTITVNVTAGGGPCVRARAVDKSGAEIDEQQRTGAGAISLTASAAGAHYIAVWPVNQQGDPLGEPVIHPSIVMVPAAGDGEPKAITAAFCALISDSVSGVDVWYPDAKFDPEAHSEFVQIEPPALGGGAGRAGERFGDWTCEIYCVAKPVADGNDERNLGRAQEIAELVRAAVEDGDIEVAGGGLLRLDKPALDVLPSGDDFQEAVVRIRGRYQRA